MLGGYLNYKLCGRAVDSTGSQVGYLPFDFKRQHWAPSWDWKWQAMAMRPEMLPDLVPPGTVIGEISREAASATGIPRGHPADRRRGQGLRSDRRRLPAAAYRLPVLWHHGHHQHHHAEICRGDAVHSALPGGGAGYVQHRNPDFPRLLDGQLVQREQFGHLEKMAAEHQGIVPEMLFDELVNTVPPGSMGLMLQPYWSPGIRFPGPEAKGRLSALATYIPAPMSPGDSRRTGVFIA